MRSRSPSTRYWCRLTDGRAPTWLPRFARSAPPLPAMRGRPYVLKLSSWNTLFCDIVTEAFPETHWVLSLRDPVEVGVSLLRQPPGWLSGDDGGVARPRRDRRSGRIARSHARSSSRAPTVRSAQRWRASTPRRGRLVAYEALPAAVWDVVAPHFSLPVDARQRADIAQAARTHAKAPLGRAAEFVPDAATKQAAASAELRRAIDSFARPQLERLVRLHARVTAGVHVQDARDGGLGSRQPFQPEHAPRDLRAMVAPRVGQDPVPDGGTVLVLRGLRVTREHGRRCDPRESAPRRPAGRSERGSAAWIPRRRRGSHRNPRRSRGPRSGRARRAGSVTRRASSSRRAPRATACRAARSRHRCAPAAASAARPPCPRRSIAEFGPGQQRGQRGLGAEVQVDRARSRGALEEPPAPGAPRCSSP